LRGRVLRLRSSGRCASQGRRSSLRCDPPASALHDVVCDENDRPFGALPDVESARCIRRRVIASRVRTAHPSEKHRGRRQGRAICRRCSMPPEISLGPCAMLRQPTSWMYSPRDCAARCGRCPPGANEFDVLLDVSHGSSAAPGPGRTSPAPCRPAMACPIEQFSSRRLFEPASRLSSVLLPHPDAPTGTEIPAAYRQIDAIKRNVRFVVLPNTLRRSAIVKISLRSSGRRTGATAPRDHYR